ncbi:DNA polymerase III subunit epsilon [Sandaracinobacter neustonicus]|uniref:DNA polymerase III subunit epsilon n=2 Tax=Sandaracinobacter neustonicus TaxID=1715348 RepID=A0A501XSG6_9SPHN|nr:DNA polymerase III subunit epsilon [Sandaracinobacter neustonicus]
MREIVFDTETTGLDPRDGHRLVEFAGIELFERVPTGRHLHLYVNPGRSMPAEAQAVHGLSEDFLADKPRFAAVAAEILTFIEGATLIAHNAAFDMRFLNYELELCGRGAIGNALVVDTLELARKRFPGAKHSLDALCQRFGIDRSHRVLHGALIDAELLADVYVELTGGRQIGFDLAVTAEVQVDGPTKVWPRRQWAVPLAELEAHADFVGRMKEPLWLKHS